MWTKSGVMSELLVTTAFFDSWLRALFFYYSFIWRYVSRYVEKNRYKNHKYKQQSYFGMIIILFT